MGSLERSFKTLTLPKWGFFTQPHTQLQSKSFKLSNLCHWDSKSTLNTPRYIYKNFHQNQHIYTYIYIQCYAWTRVGSYLSSKFVESSNGLSSFLSSLSFLLFLLFFFSFFSSPSLFRLIVWVCEMCVWVMWVLRDTYGILSHVSHTRGLWYNMSIIGQQCSIINKIKHHLIKSC